MEYYRLKKLKTGLTRITRRGEDFKGYRFISEYEILPNQKAKYSLTINKTKKKPDHDWVFQQTW
jgi:hypothetical protein